MIDKSSLSYNEHQQILKSRSISRTSSLKSGDFGFDEDNDSKIQSEDLPDFDFV